MRVEQPHDRRAHCRDDRVSGWDRRLDRPAPLGRVKDGEDLTNVVAIAANLCALRA